MNVGRGFGVDFGFGALHPGFVLNEAAFEVADSGEVFVEFFLVAFAKIGVEFFGLAQDGIEDAATPGEAFDLGFDFRWSAIDEELLEGARRGGFGGEWDATGGPGHGLAAGAEDKAREASLGADVFGDELVNGDCVSESSEAGVFGRGEPGHFGGVTVGSILLFMLEA